MIRSLSLAAVATCAVAIGACNGADLVVEDDRTDTDVTDEDSDADDTGDTDSGPAVLAAPVLTVEVYNVTTTTVRLSWTHAAPAGCCSFKVYYGGALAGPFTLFGEVAAPPLVTGLNAETLYYFYVVAVKDGVESAASLVRPVLTKPGLATNFRIDRIGGGGFVLAWDPVEGASGFNVYRSAPGGTEVTELSPFVHVGGAETSAAITDLESTASYVFKMNVEKGAFRMGDLSAAITGTTGTPITVGAITPDYGFDDQQVTISGTDLGTNAAEVTVIFEGEAGPGDEKLVIATTASDTAITAKVPTNSVTGVISVRRFLYAKESTSAVYTVGDMLSFGKVSNALATPVTITALHAASATHVLAGRQNGTLLRSTSGGSFTALDYAPALSDDSVHDCADLPFDSAAQHPLTGIQCVGDNCLVALGKTCNSVRIAGTFTTTPTLFSKRLGPPSGAAIGVTTWLACGNPTDPLGCLSIDQTGTTVTAAYSADFVATDFTALALAVPPNGDFTWLGLRGRPDAAEVVIYGLGNGAPGSHTQGLLAGAYPFTSFDLVTDAPGDLTGADCAYDATTSYCVGAASEHGLTQGSGATTAAVGFNPVTDVAAGASFFDTECPSFQTCIAVGGVSIGTTDEKGVVAQTTDGARWFYRFVGTRALYLVSCAGGSCFASDSDGAVWRGN